MNTERVGGCVVESEEVLFLLPQFSLGSRKQGDSAESEDKEGGVGVWTERRRCEVITERESEWNRDK